MGVKLQELIVRNKIEFSELEGKILAIDAPNVIMSLFNFARKNPDGSRAGLILDRFTIPRRFSRFFASTDSIQSSRR
jgi:hypothetical protein